MTVDDPREQLPLDSLPIEWVEPRVCEETFDNRRLLRENGHRWRPVPPDPATGIPSGLIEVPDPAVTQRAMIESHRDLLVDPRDPWSDYVDCRELPADATGAPFWIHRKAEQWREWDERQRLPGSRRSREPHLPTRCASIKKDGTRCWAWAADAANDGHCRAHAPGAALAANMGHQIALAKVKVMQAMPAMADALEELALTAASEQVRLKAVTEMMDRGGVTASTDVHISGGVTVERDPAVEIRERLAGLAERLAQAPELAAPGVVEGEVLADGKPEGAGA